MKYTGVLIIMFFFSHEFNFFNDFNRSSSISDMLAGDWIVDLKPSKESESYLKEFVVHEIIDNTFKGVFYDTKFENGLINNNWDSVYFAFSTKDANNSYYHSGFVAHGEMYGITYCKERGFVMPWTGTKYNKE